MLPVQEARFLSLVREPRSHVPCSLAKTYKTKSMSVSMEAKKKLADYVEIKGDLYDRTVKDMEMILIESGLGVGPGTSYEGHH